MQNFNSIRQKGAKALILDFSKSRIFCIKPTVKVSYHNKKITEMIRG